MEPVPQKYRDALLPRYTSYPTAPHFSPDIGSTTYSEWLSRVAEGEAISLYLHVLQDYVLVGAIRTSPAGTSPSATILNYCVARSD
jgi:oxygen-independent coproporphyrinogen-3 oxidase